MTRKKTIEINEIPLGNNPLMNFILFCQVSSLLIYYLNSYIFIENGISIWFEKYILSKNMTMRNRWLRFYGVFG